MGMQVHIDLNLAWNGNGDLNLAWNGNVFYEQLNCKDQSFQTCKQVDLYVWTQFAELCNET